MKAEALQRINGKKVRYWVKADIAAGQQYSRVLVNTVGSILPGVSGNIPSGNVPYPMSVTSVRCQYRPDGLGIQQLNQHQAFQFIAESTIEIQKANQVTVFEWAWSDCQRAQLVIPPANSFLAIDFTSREKKLEGNKQSFALGDLCSVYINFGYAPFSYSGSILIEINGYTI